MNVKRVAAVGVQLIAVEQIDPDCYIALQYELDHLEQATWVGHVRDMLKRESALQLALNLGTIAKLIASGTVFTAIPDGITSNERWILEQAARHLSPKAQLAVHGVLNLHERQLFIEYFGSVFNAHKCKHTQGEEHGQESREEQTQERAGGEERVQAGCPGGPDRTGVPQDPRCL